MLGFSGKQFVKEVTDFGSTYSKKLATVIQENGSRLIREVQEKLIPELKGYTKTEPENGEYKFLIVMAGIKKENVNVRNVDNKLYVTGKNYQGDILVDFSQPIGKDTVVSAKLEDGIMTVTMKVTPINTDINVE